MMEWKAVQPSPEMALQGLCLMCPTLRSAVKMLTAPDSQRALRRVARHRAQEALRVIGEVTALDEERLRAASVQIERLFVQHYPGWREW